MNFTEREVLIFFTSMLPVTELRGALPLALGLGVSPFWAYIICVAGNILPVFPLLIFLEKFSTFLQKRYKIFEIFFKWFFERSYRRSKIVQRWGKIGLMCFVAVPFPLTGAWTGAMLSYLLGMKKSIAFLFISAGVCIAAFLVLLASLGVAGLFHHIRGVAQW